jgi:ATP/maltotriose-dependent transcriptional regulator MalT
MDDLKRMTLEGIGHAMLKAERYRLLGEPCEAESICRDVLEVTPDNHEARVVLILSLTDQLRTDLSRAAEAAGLAAALEQEYERFYYSGVVAERLGKAQLTRGGPCSDDYANRALREAMAWYEKAEAVRPTGNDDAVLRWNTCARTIARRGFTGPADTSSPALLMTE